MTEATFQLRTVTRIFTEGTAWVEAVGFPEVSAVDDSARSALACLVVKARALLEDPNLAPTLALHRRRVAGPVEVAEVEVTFRPPAREPDWETPVTLRLRYVRWSEGDLHHGMVPGLGVHVFGPDAEALSARVGEHVRLVLAGRGRRLTLAGLARVARAAEWSLGEQEVRFTRRTPLERAREGADDGGEASTLASLADELSTRHARRESTVDPAFELEAELGQVAALLSGAQRGSVLLVGAPGSGKTALVRELARRRRDFGLGERAFWSTTGARLMVGQIGFGMWQERCQAMCREAAKTDAILHLASLAELLEVGRATRGQQSVGSFLRPWLARGDVVAVAECTPEQVSAIERDEPQLLAAFQRWVLPERTPNQTRAILAQVLEASPGRVGGDPEGNARALERLHAMHLRYATYSAQPGRPLRFLKNLLADRFPERQLDESQVIAAFSRETGLPRVLLDDDVPLDAASTREWLAQRVIGQGAAVERVVDLLLMIKARLARPRKPLASFLFIGPTGTGKTEMAKALAAFLFGDVSRLVRFDLNEFQDPMAVQRLMGGGVAKGSEGLLTARIREQPFSVVLLDEFEKAHASFYDLLLQILGDGRLTDAAGRVADFCNSVLVMTSNLGADVFQRGPAGFASAGGSTGPVSSFQEAVRGFLRPEIYNRLDAIVPFDPLDPEVTLGIARRQLAVLGQRDGLRLRPIDWMADDDVVRLLATRGFSERYGARPLKRVLERELLVPLAEILNSYREETPLGVRIQAEAGQFRIECRARDEEAATTSTVSDGAEEAREVVALRRRVARLRKSAALVRLEDEVTFLESLERQQMRTRATTPSFQKRLLRLPLLRDLTRGVHHLAARVETLETERLVGLYQRESRDAATGVGERFEIRDELERLARGVFREQQENPDDVVLAIFGEDRAWLLKLIEAYHAAARRMGSVVAVDVFLPPASGRGKEVGFPRETPREVEAWFKRPPEKWLGAILRLHGDLFRAQWSGEAGLHVLRADSGESTCLVVVPEVSFHEYQPPREIDRPGSWRKLGAPVCRTFEPAFRRVRDAVLGELPWSGGDLDLCLEGMSEERLKRLIESQTA